MEIIKDIRGGTLRLSKTRLTEITGCVHSYEQWFLTLKNLKSTVEHFGKTWFVYIQLLPGARQVSRTGNVAYNLDECSIGCRTFTKTTFRKILKAAKIKVKI